MKLIDKDALVVEIENLENTYKKCPTRNSYEDGLKVGRLIGYKDALHKIDTLEAKEADAWHLQEKENRNMEIIHHRNEWNWGKSVACVTNDGYGIATISFFKDDTQVLQAVISGISVHNTHRQFGYGNLLLNECEKEAKNNGFAEVSLWCVPNSVAYNWYKRKGYIETNEMNESLIRLKKSLE